MSATYDGIAADVRPAWIETCWPRFHEVLSAALTS